MAAIFLVPSGVHRKPGGAIRYAIWLWHDADGERRIPCAAIAMLERTATGPTCADARAVVPFDRSAAGRSLARVMQSHGLVDDADRLTEKGATIRLLFRRRRGVIVGWETAHGLLKWAPEDEASILLAPTAAPAVAIGGEADDDVPW